LKTRRQSRYAGAFSLGGRSGRGRGRAFAGARAAVAFGVGAALWAPTAARADINIEFRAAAPAYEVGQTVDIGVYLRSDSMTNQLASAAQIVLGWDVGFLRLLGLSGAGGAPLLSSSFPRPDPYGLNEATPPMDGDAFYVALANFGAPIAATPSGALLTTLRFEALAQTIATRVEVLASGGSPSGRTAVYDATVPNHDITGTLSGASVSIIPAPIGASFMLLGTIALAAKRRR